MLNDKMKNIAPSANGTIFINPYGKASNRLNILPPQLGDSSVTGSISGWICFVRSSTSIA